MRSPIIRNIGRFFGRPDRAIQRTGHRITLTRHKLLPRRSCVQSLFVCKPMSKQSGRQLHRKCITRVQFYLQRKFACASVRSKVFFAYYIFTQTFLCTRLSWTYVSHAMDKPIIVLTAWEVVGGVPVLERRNSRYKRGTYFTGSLTKAARKLFWQAAMALNFWSQGECL